MGREVKRVHRDFNWPMEETWAGYLLNEVRCPLCSKFDRSEHNKCPVCYGEGFVCPKIEPPKGWEHEGTNYWQMWETCSEGSPISPPLPTPEALAHWLADNNASAFGRMTATYEEWLAMIVGPGSAVSAVMTADGKFTSGVSAKI